MKVGDLVKMKYDIWRKSQSTSAQYPDPGIVFGIAGKGIKVLMPDGKVKVGLIDHWEIIQTVKK